MKNWILSLAFLLLTAAAGATTVDGQFFVVTNDGTTYSVRVQLKADVATGLGGATLAFTYNTSDLSIPASPAAGTDYSFQNYSGGSYSASVTQPIPGRVSVNIEYNGADGAGTLVNTSYSDVVTINFTTVNASGQSNLSWVTTEVIDDDQETPWTTGTFTDENTTPLPIQLASSAANVIRGNDVEVGWKTVSETNNYGFEVYRKRGEAGEWTKVGFVEGHGTTLAPQSYSYIDRSLSFGQYFYRIKQIDLDGRSETFPEMAVTVGGGAEKFVLAQNYPNPFNPSTVIEFVVPVSGHTTLRVYNVLGQEVARLFEGNAEAGKVNAARFDASSLPSGLYFYTLKNAAKTETKRMLLVK